ncbi:laminin G domain-containing protein [Mangrovihabitans endophyticus]|nr:laminin G domain-containing protein [Mangrovihabitans endophyticus]
MLSRRLAAVAALSVPLLVAPLAMPGAAVARRSGDSRELVALYRFDSGRVGGTVADDSGRGHAMRVAASNGGEWLAVPRAGGRAAQLPTACAARRSCPRMVLQSGTAGDLNPWRRSLAYGATVRLPGDQTSKGQNILQKGYSATSSQYKLQIDGYAGKPSCVLVGRHDTQIRIVRSAVPVADGAWHDVSCRRSRSVFTIIVDGMVRGRAWVPTTLSVANSHPLSIGGKGGYYDNDQFQGAIDDVWLMIG